MYYHCKPEFDWLRNPYCHPEELQIEDVLNTKPYWQHLELIQIEDTVKQIKPERKHLTLFEIMYKIYNNEQFLKFLFKGPTHAKLKKK